MKDPVDIDLNKHLDNEDYLEALYDRQAEDRRDAADQLEALKDVQLEEIFYDVVMNFKEGYLKEIKGMEIAYGICSLYHSLPLENGRLCQYRSTHSERRAWDLIQAIRLKDEDVRDLLEYLWEQR